MQPETEVIALSLGRVFRGDAQGVRVRDRPPRWGGLAVASVVVATGLYGFVHGVLREAWYALPGLLAGVPAFFVVVRLAWGALTEQELVCTPREVVLRRFRGGHEVAPRRLAAARLARVGRGEVAYTKYGPVHGLLFIARDGETIESLQSMPAQEMQGFLHRLESLRYPVVFDDATPRDARLGDTPPRGLLRWL